MISNLLKPMKEILLSSYGKYMACAGLLVTCAGYDEYRMNQICNIMDTKYSADGVALVVANNKFMCPFTKIDIYTLDRTPFRVNSKYNLSTYEKTHVATEVCLTMPPIIELGNEVFICDADKCIKVGKKLVNKKE